MIRTTSPYLLLSPYPLFLSILGAITMFTKSYTKSQNWISSLYIILLLIIPQTIHIMYRKFVFQAIPEPELRCSRPRFKAFQVCSKPFQRNSKCCSKFVPSFILLPSFAQAFSKSLSKREKNYTKTTPELHRI